MNKVEKIADGHCRWCGGECWYTSWSGGVEHRKPCDYCNLGGHPPTKEIAPELPEGVARALTVDGAPVPDSLWFGKWSFLREPVPEDPALWRWSPLGLAVRRHLESMK